MNVMRSATEPVFKPYILKIVVHTSQEHRVLQTLMRADVAVPRALSATLVKFSSADEAALRQCMQYIYAAM